ncbi:MULTISPECIES: dTMP kinase [unclassified Streptomyces]|uniref:dTMP kinase n=1 Tax=unclassified Streptomyces TaxID=2593676 RepID=UPI00190B319C|nr:MULTISPECIES: dTMP kinase [unclassified Streptomyces]MBK3571231.1 thymidylate kinase [Streptomyces sp. MBT62]MBK6017086.1 thymidylate kinase [Streptomyces sp. MBT53]
MSEPSPRPTAERGPGSIEKRATLIAVEGTDGVGKTTAALRLVEELRARGHSVTWFPNRTFRPVRQALERLAQEEGLAHRFELFGPDFGQLLPSVMKWRELLELEPELGRPGHFVVTDRYKHAWFALANTFGTGNEPLLRRLYAALPEPDVVLYLDVDPRVAAERVERRGVDRNTVEHLSRFRSAFHALPEFPSFRVVDAGQAADAVFQDLWDDVAALVPGGREPAARAQVG